MSRTLMLTLLVLVLGLAGLPEFDRQGSDVSAQNDDGTPIPPRP